MSDIIMCEYVFSFTKDVQVDIHMVVDVNAETIQTLDYMRDIMLRNAANIRCSR